MNPEKPQFEAFWNKKDDKEKPSSGENRNAEPRESEEAKRKAVGLATEAKTAFAANDLQGTLEKLRELARAANPEREGDLEFQEARELFGKDFIGPEAAFKTFGVKLTPEETKQIERIPFNKAELEKAKELGMMLVLRVSHDKDGKPLTINRMREVLAGEDKLGDPSKKKQKLFYRQPGEGWYDDEEFAKQETSLGWGLVMKAVLEESRSKNWGDQEKVMQDWAKKNGIDPKSIRRRTPVEVAYDTLAYYGANKETLLEKDYDWTGARSSVGGFVDVGVFGSDGLHVGYGDRGDSGSRLGVCPSR
jgi:hypothetical protein